MRTWRENCSSVKNTFLLFFYLKGSWVSVHSERGADTFLMLATLGIDVLKRWRQTYSTRAKMARGRNYWPNWFLFFCSDHCPHTVHNKCIHTHTSDCIQTVYQLPLLDSGWNVMAHGDARERNWRGNWRMEWVVSTLHTTSEHGVSSITTADAHTSAASSRLNWPPLAGPI